MALHARHADLALIGQPKEEEGMAGPQHALLEELLFHSGRPVLVVPWAGKANPEPRTVIVAWDASGTAARAVADALAILRHAKKVVVLVAMAAGRVPMAISPASTSRSILRATTSRRRRARFPLGPTSAWPISCYRRRPIWARR